MKTITTIILATFMTLSVANRSNAQNYKQSAGVRLGETSALTYKYFVEDQHAVELMVSGRAGGVQGTFLYEHYTPVPVSFTNDLHFLYGGGVHVGVTRPYNYEKWRHYGPNENHLTHAIGVDGIIGVEYVWYKVPLTFGFEIKPFLDIAGFRYAHINFWDSGISVKYIFK